ncbi:hypothetical protein AAVH_19799 [Aphelenchoides avenae]|nr:hypothetical protein AAVH_19799 [Aphelenchus avenae]
MEFLGAIIAKFRHVSDVSIGEENDLQTSQTNIAAQSTETGMAENGAQEASISNASTEGDNSSDHSTPTNSIGRDESVVPSAGHILSGGVPFRARCRGRASAAVPVVHSATAISDGSMTKADRNIDVVPPSVHRPSGRAAGGGPEDSFEAVGADSTAASNTGTVPERDVTTRQGTSRPDVPVDPITAARDQDAIQHFVTTVYTTLYSLPHGYDSIARLLRDLSEDSGLDGESVASELGYESFEAFLHSSEMAPRILVGASPDGRPRYKVYPTKADLERYVAQQLGTDYGDTKRALARQREENNRLRRHLASTMERVEKLRSEALAKHQPKPAIVHEDAFTGR